MSNARTFVAIAVVTNPLVWAVAALALAVVALAVVFAVVGLVLLFWCLVIRWLAAEFRPPPRPRPTTLMTPPAPVTEPTPAPSDAPRADVAQVPVTSAGLGRGEDGMGSRKGAGDVSREGVVGSPAQVPPAPAPVKTVAMKGKGGTKRKTKVKPRTASRT